MREASVNEETIRESSRNYNRMHACAITAWTIKTCVQLQSQKPRLNFFLRVKRICTGPFKTGGELCWRALFTLYLERQSLSKLRGFYRKFASTKVSTNCVNFFPHSSSKSIFSHGFLFKNYGQEISLKMPKKKSLFSQFFLLLFQMTININDRGWKWIEHIFPLRGVTSLWKLTFVALAWHHGRATEKRVKQHTPAPW